MHLCCYSSNPLHSADEHRRESRFFSFFMRISTPLRDKCPPVSQSMPVTAEPRPSKFQGDSCGRMPVSMLQNYLLLCLVASDRDLMLYVAIRAVIATLLHAALVLFSLQPVSNV
jgi:hypothetical protein